MRFFFLSLLFSCSTTTTQLAQNCDVFLYELDTEMASVGDTVSALGHPMTSVWDTAVYVGDVRASLIDVTRDGCETCDECREQAGCDACSECASCAEECTDTCVEHVQFVVPEISAGESNVSMYNGHGQSNGLPLHVGDPSVDTGTDDSGSTEDTSSVSDTSDSGTSDSGTSDSGTSTVDTGTSEHTDTAAVDTSSPDTGG
jgi:hypothetical protein